MIDKFVANDGNKKLRLGICEVFGDEFMKQLFGVGKNRGREAPEVHRYAGIHRQLFGLLIVVDYYFTVFTGNVDALGNGAEIAFGVDLAYAAVDRAVVGQCFQQIVSYDGIYFGGAIGGQELVSLLKRIAAIKVV